MEIRQQSEFHEFQTSLTIDIDGSSLPFEKFLKAQEELAAILIEVDQKLCNRDRPCVSWVVSSIESGSVHLTIKGQPSDSVAENAIAEVLSTVKAGIRILEERPERPPFFSDKALTSAKHLARLISKDEQDEHGISTIGIGLNSSKTNITHRLAENVDELIGANYRSLGSLEGVLRAIDLSKKPLFRIYDLLTNKSVICYFEPCLINKIKDALNKRVSVYGLIRSREDGKKISIKVEDMEIFPNETDLPSIEDIIGILGGEG